MSDHLLSRAPFVRITLLYIAGIVLALLYPNNSNYFYYLIAAFVVILTIIIKLLNRRYYYINILYGIIISLIFILVPYTFTSYKLNSVTNKENLNGILISNVSSSKKYKNNFYKIELNILSKKYSINSKTLNTNAIAFLKSDTDTFNIQIGDYILLNSEFKDVEPAKNPYQFDYKSYLKYSDISKIGFVNNKNWKLIKNKEFNIFRLSEDLRQFFIDRFNQFNIKPKNLAVINAIVLGDKSNLSDELGTEFANAGVMHILAVSGLHVGILFLILTLLFKSFAGYKVGKYLKFILILTILWSYAFITGLSPSVVRSVIMFSLVSISLVIERQHNIYNTVFVSAFLLLVFNPFYLLKIGFQLSYLAVLGIIFFQPKISKLIKSKNKIIRYFWDLIAVSFAAQISTAPLTLYYFSKFPNYFIITNLMVMMLVTMILTFGIAFLALSYVPILNSFIAKSLDFLLDIMNFIIHKVNTFPKSITDNINVDFFEMISIYSIIIFFSFYMINRNKKSIVLLSISFIVFISYYNYNFITNYNKQKLIFFNIKQHSFIGIIDNNKSYLFCDEKYDKAQNDINFSIKKYFIRGNTNKIELKYLDNNETFENRNIFCNSNFLKFKEKTIFLANDNYTTPENNISVDYLYLINYNKKKFNELISKINPKEIVISNKIPKYFEDDIIEICNSKGIKYYSTIGNDAHILEM
jgi:competence protein ComEC